MYYLLVLIELTVLSPILLRMLKTDRLKYVPFFITPAYLLGMTLCLYCFGIDFAWKGRFFAAWITYYYFGMYIQHYGWQVKKYRRYVWCLAAGAVLSFAEAGWVIKNLNSMAYAVTQVKISSYFYSLGLIGIFMCRHGSCEISKKNWFVSLGDLSYGIYLSHIMVKWIVDKTFRVMGITILNTLPLPVSEILEMGVLLVVSAGIVSCCRRLDKKGFLIRWVGFC